MFGNIKNKVEERIKETLTPIYEQRDSLETKVSAIEEGEKRMHMDICQVTNNTAELTNYVSHNIEEENALMHQMDACAKNLKTVADEHTEIVKTIKNYHEALTDLVEDNKHYTTPSKYLTEVPSVLRQTYQSHETKMDEMAECGRKMSMMALNAAIEAGRMGESGTQFVEISEEIRQASFVYEQAALSMKEEFKDTQKKLMNWKNVYFVWLHLSKTEMYLLHV